MEDGVGLYQGKHLAHANEARPIPVDRILDVETLDVAIERQALGDEDVGDAEVDAHHGPNRVIFFNGNAFDHADDGASAEGFDTDVVAAAFLQGVDFHIAAHVAGQGLVEERDPAGRTIDREAVEGVLDDVVAQGAPRLALVIDRVEREFGGWLAGRRVGLRGNEEVGLVAQGGNALGHEHDVHGSGDVRGGLFFEERNRLAGLVDEPRAVAEGAQIGGTVWAEQGDVSPDHVVARPPHGVEDDDGEAVGHGDLHALGDVAEHVAEDLAAHDQRLLDVLQLAHIAAKAALAVLVVVHGFQEPFPKGHQFLLRIVGIVQGVVQGGELLG